MALQDVLRGHKVSEVMTQDCQVVPSTLTVEQLVNDHILVSGRRCYPVVDYGRALGLVTVHRRQSRRTKALASENRQGDHDPHRQDETGASRR